MPLVGEAVELASSPANRDGNVRLEDSRDTAYLLETYVLELASLEQRDDGLADTGAPRDVRPARFESESEESQPPAQPNVVHPGYGADDWLSAGCFRLLGRFFVSRVVAVGTGPMRNHAAL